ncbi:hypothetical protein [Coleofasciculus sp.]|uniref:hypothetical protein n=1 Tax=Coleofasciculus sp. TaxID=3100458 RepID=UPI003A357639
MSNFNTESQPPLFTPGKQGWTTPKPKQFQLSQASTKQNNLTTKQLQKHLGVSQDVLRTCPMGTVLSLNTYLIWHQGRDSWKLYEEKLVE